MKEIAQEYEELKKRQFLRKVYQISAEEQIPKSIEKEYRILLELGPVGDVFTEKQRFLISKLLKICNR